LGFCEKENALETEQMTRFKSGQEAEKAMLQGRIESQDSQAILDAYKAEFGVGTVCSVRHGHVHARVSNCA
jgi:hypothetical protein